MMNFPEIDRDEESETARHRYLLLCEKRRVEALTLSVKEMEQRIKRLQEFEHLSRRQSQQIQQLEEANRLLQAQNQDQLQVQEHLNSEKQSSLASYEELKKQFDQKSEECFLVGEELNAVREELSTLKHSNTLVNGQVAELTERISTEQNRFEELHQNKIEIEEELATVQNLHVKLISETKALKNKVQELQREGQFHEQNRTEVQSELDQAKKRLEERSKDFEHLHREMQRIKKTLIEGIKENKALEERFVSVVQEKAQLQASLSASSEIQQQQMRTIESLQLKSEEEHLCAQKQEAKIASLNEALDLQRTRQSLDAQRYRALEEEKREVEKKLEALAVELKDTHAVVDNYREDLVAIQLGARQEREEKAEVQRQLDEMTALHEKEKTARAALEGELKQLQESLILSSSRESECKKTISEREQELSELQKAHGELHEELMTLQRQITSHDEEITFAQQHLAKKMKEMALLEEEWAQEVREREKLQTEREHWLQEHEKIQEERQGQRTRIDELENQVESLQEQLTQTTMAHEEEIIELREALRLCEEQKQRFSELEEKQSQIHTALASLGQVIEITRTPKGGAERSSSPQIPSQIYPSPQSLDFPPFEEDENSSSHE